MNAPENLKDIRFKYGLAKSGGQFTEMLALPHKKLHHTEKMRYSTKNRKRDPIRDELRESIRKIALCLAIVAGGWVAGAAGMLIYILFTA